MITRETFIESIEAIKKQLNAETALCDVLTKEPFDTNIVSLSGFLIDAFIKVLAEDLKIPEHGIIGNDIAYYVFERNFDGASSPFVIIVKGKRKKKIYIKNAGELYDFLTRKGKK